MTDIDIQAIKTGMLFDASNTRAVADVLRTHYANTTMPPLVCDPVCVSTSGHTLLQPEAIEVMISELFPLTALITPNKSEAELLLSHQNLPCKIENLEDMLVAAKNLSTFAPKSILLKGGHITTSMLDVRRVSKSHPDLHIVEDGVLGQNTEILQIIEEDSSAQPLVVDVLYEPEGKTTLFLRPRVDSKNTHGTGCTLSAALACELGRGLNCQSATNPSIRYD